MQKRWCKFTINELSEGELAIRKMSKKAQEAYRGTDMIKIACYEIANNRSNEEYIDWYHRHRFAIIYDGIYTECDLKFEELQKMLEDYYDAINEEE